MFRVVIVDDEQHSVHRIRDLLADFPDCVVVGEANDGSSAVQMIEAMRPDLIFLDITMPELTGFDVLDRVSYAPLVVFVTAYHEYAIKAFEKGGIDYLLKPVSRERFSITMQRVFKNRQTLNADMMQLLKSVAESRKYLSRFAVRARNDILVVPQNDVFYFKAEDKYVFLCTDEHEFLYETTLKHLEERLDPDTFIRIHKSYIVALDKIKKLKKTVISDYIAVMCDKRGSELRVGRAFIDSLRERLSF